MITVAKNTRVKTKKIVPDKSDTIQSYIIIEITIEDLQG
jgi:hypothetical protein